MKRASGAWVAVGNNFCLLPTWIPPKSVDHVGPGLAGRGEVCRSIDHAEKFIDRLVCVKFSLKLVNKISLEMNGERERVDR